MKLAATLLGLLVVCLLVRAQGPQILYVSSSPSTIITPVYTSLRGGRLIYIKAIGHSPVAT